MNLEITGVTKRFSTAGGVHVALDDVSLSIGSSEVFGIVGESGSGKTTIARCVVGIERIDAGSITHGDRIIQPSPRRRRSRDSRIQLVFQDPMSSLNPRMTAGDLIDEGLNRLDGDHTSAWRRGRVLELLKLVGLNEADIHRYPHSFSGGQRQRIAIARAMSVQPDILLCDEPVSSLDVSVQAQVLNVLRDLHEHSGVTIVLISHDIAVVRHMCSRVAVMYGGRVVENGRVETVLDNPTDPYTRSLIDSVPVPNPALERARYALAAERIAITPR